MSTKTLTLNTSSLYLRSLESLSLSSPPPSDPPPIPSGFPLSKLIPNTRFIVDGFRHAGKFSDSYFLTHFHSDHYAGINPNWSHGIIYCSNTTARVAIHVLDVSPMWFVPLPMNETVIIDGCEVTLIDANHCPGAVQFLFRVPVGGGGFQRFVHTGDFRFKESMILECSSLSKFVGCDALFLDTTYCDPKFVFPSQEESIDYVVDVINRVGADGGLGNKGVLFLVATYVIGKERILVEISRRCGRKICVDSRKMEVLRALGYGDDEVFTLEESYTDVHVVGWNVLGETWPYFRPNFVKMKEIMDKSGYSKVVGFVPTGWTYEVKKNKFALRTKDMFEIHLVPYSEHSNYNELREYVKFLKPKQVIPTVGSDVENLDSKHAVKMRKHFAGLMDEMANKQEFLTGFFRASQAEVKAKLDDPMIGSEDELESHEEVSGMRDVKFDNIADSDSILCPSTSLHEPGSQDVDMLRNKEREEIMQELRDCLPVWVSEDQILELIQISGKNVVDAVSYFYEHETKFHEKSASSISSSHSDSKTNCTPVLEANSVKSPAPKVLQLPNQGLKFPSLKHSARSSVSSRKSRRYIRNNQKKKAKVNSIPEPRGIKQSTITSFFGKNGDVCQGSSPDPMSGKSIPNKSFPGENSVRPYQEQLEQFIEIIDDYSESTRSRSTELIEKARGNIELALDLHYNNSKVQLDDNKDKVDISIKTAHIEGAKRPKTYYKEREAKPADKVYLLEPESLSHNVTVGNIALPPEKYFPVEHACWKHGQPAPYIHMARTFSLVEAEKGKIKATSMICNMFRSLLALSPEDVLPAVYLCTNKIAADHENIELNVGGSLVASAIEEACGTDRAKIREIYHTLGDLGDVAQEFRQTQSFIFPPSPLLIRDVYAALRKISLQTGSGSMGRRRNMIVGLMRCCREKEMKYLVRTLVRNLRIGAMMRSVLPALAQAVALNSQPCDEREVKNPKELLQGLSAAVVEAYNVVPDLGVLVPLLMSKGIEFSTTTLTMVPGIPIRPMLAKISNGVVQALKLFQNKAFTCEYKYDGQRAQIHKLDDGSVHIFSRNGDETTSRFPDLVHIIQDLCKFSAGSFIIDAEVVGIDHKNGGKFLSFQELSTRERGSKASLVTLDRIKVDICVRVFDIMFVNGEKLLAYPLRKRRQCMKDLFTDENPGYFEYAKQITIEADDAHPGCEATLTKINCFFEDAFKSSCEGIMVKALDVDAGYFASKRADSWLKVKRDYLDGMGDSLDLVPIGAWYGNGRKAGWYSPFLMACYNPDTEEFESVCRVMSGFSDSFYIEMKEFFSEVKIVSKKPMYYRTDENPDTWFSAELVWEIRGADFTVSPAHKAAVGLVHPSRGISMRFPRFVRSVSDRRPEDCTTSSDIAELFQGQTRKMDASVSH